MLPHGGGLVVAMPAQQMGNLSPGHVSLNRMTSPIQNPGVRQQKMLGQPSNTKVALQNMLSNRIGPGGQPLPGAPGGVNMAQTAAFNSQDR